MRVKRTRTAEEASSKIGKPFGLGGIPPQDEKIFAALDGHGACLLFERMRILRLDPQFFAEDPAAFHELQINCSACEARAACIVDLRNDAINPTGTNWYDYCPNVAALRMYSALANLDAPRSDVRSLQK
jgi:hypothetical protein